MFFFSRRRSEEKSSNAYLSRDLLADEPQGGRRTYVLSGSLGSKRAGPSQKFCRTYVLRSIPSRDGPGNCRTFVLWPVCVMLLFLQACSHFAANPKLGEAHFLQGGLGLQILFSAGPAGQTGRPGLDGPSGTGRRGRAGTGRPDLAWKLMGKSMGNLVGKLVVNVVGKLTGNGWENW